MGKLKILIFLIVFCSGIFVLANGVLAQAIPEVFVTDLSLIKEEHSAGEKIKGSFTLNNVGDYYLDQIQYQIYLLSEEKLGNLLLIDLQTSKEFLKFSPKQEIVNHQFSYHLPLNLLSGQYILRLGLIDSKGTKLGWQDQRIKIQGNERFIQILEGSLVRQGEGFPLQMGPSFKENQKPWLRLKIFNPAQDSLTVYPKVVVNKRMENMEEITSWSDKSITLEGQKEKIVIIDLPQIDLPDVYLASIQFYEGEQPISGLVQARWVVAGSSAKIFSIISQQNTFQKGETAKISFHLIGSADLILPAEGEEGTIIENALLKVKILDGKEKLCGQAEKTIEKLAAQIENVELEISIEKDCPGPKILAELSKDDSILDSSSLSLVPEKAVGLKTAAGIVILILLLIGFWWLRKRQFKTLPIILVIFSLGLVFVFQANEVQAAKGDCTGYTAGAWCGYKCDSNGQLCDKCALTSACAATVYKNCEACPACKSCSNDSCVNTADGTSCGTNQICCNGSCCPSGKMCCNGTTCVDPCPACKYYSGSDCSKCVNVPDGILCASGYSCCGGTCCPNTACCNGTCCPSGQACCGSTCYSSGFCCYGHICSSSQVCYNQNCCTPATCASLGKECGDWSDNCGGTVSCPSCPSGKTCSNGTCVTETTGPIQIPTYVLAEPLDCDKIKVSWQNNDTRVEKFEIQRCKGENCLDFANLAYIPVLNSTIVDYSHEDTHFTADDKNKYFRYRIKAYDNGNSSDDWSEIAKARPWIICSGTITLAGLITACKTLTAEGLRAEDFIYPHVWDSPPYPAGQTSYYSFRQAGIYLGGGTNANTCSNSLYFYTAYLAYWPPTSSGLSPEDEPSLRERLVNIVDTLKDVLTTVEIGFIGSHFGWSAFFVPGDVSVATYTGTVCLVSDLMNPGEFREFQTYPVMLGIAVYPTNCKIDVSFGGSLARKVQIYEPMLQITDTNGNQIEEIDNLKIGDSVQLKAKFYNAGQEFYANQPSGDLRQTWVTRCAGQADCDGDGTITWKSSDTTKVTISSRGVAKRLKEGDVIISASYNYTVYSSVSHTVRDSVGTGPVETHKECQSCACVVVAGKDTDKCQTDADCCKSLTVSCAGKGSGTVTGGEINCACNAGRGSGTCSKTYTTGTSVTLTATPSSGSSFGGWSGDCSGTGSCALTMNANKSVTATFNPPSCDCDTRDGWYDTGRARWVDNGCLDSDTRREKEQKKQEYRDYYCSDGQCVYNVTNTRWIDTGQTQTFDCKCICTDGNKAERCKYKYCSSDKCSCNQIGNEDKACLCATDGECNNQPFANAGSDKTVNETQSVVLEGSGSDPDTEVGQTLSPSWSCTGGSLDNPNSWTPSFTAPSVNADTNYTCTLTAIDSCGTNAKSASDSMIVTVRDINLSVSSFTATPSSGNHPLNDVDLEVKVSGTAEGTVNFMFDCRDDGTWEAKYDGIDLSVSDPDWVSRIDYYGHTFYTKITSPDTFAVRDLCDYPVPGTYNAMVKVERDIAPSAQAWTTIESINNPPTASILWPKNGETISNLTPILDWEFSDPQDGTNQTGYHIQLDNNSDFSSPIINEQPDNSSTEYGVSSGLSSQTQYWWRVKVKDSAGTWSDWTPAANFWTPKSCTLSVSPETVNLLVGEQKTLTASGANGTVTWTSSNPSKVTVDPLTGLSTTITGINSSSVTITANDSEPADCQDTVAVTTSLPPPKWKEIKPE